VPGIGEGHNAKIAISTRYRTIAIQSHVCEKKSRFRPVSKIIRAPVMGCVKNATGTENLDVIL
jgi:hypothetical protein